MNLKDDKHIQAEQLPLVEPRAWECVKRIIVISIMSALLLLGYAVGLGTTYEKMYKAHAANMYESIEVIGGDGDG